MQTLKTIIALSLLTGMSFTAAADIKTLDETSRLHVNISNHEMNRISIQGDRIQQVFGADHSFSLETDEQSGQLFIKPLDAASRKAINLSLITESGLTQDLRLTPQDIAAVSLILKSVGGKAAPGTSAVANRSSSTVDELIQLVQQVMQHKLNGAYSSVPCQPKTSTNTWQYQPQQCWQGPHYQISRYKLINVSAVSQPVDAAVLADSADRAVAVGRPTLKPHTATDVVLISEVQP